MLFVNFLIGLFAFPPLEFWKLFMDLVINLFSDCGLQMFSLGLFILLAGSFAELQFLILTWLVIFFSFYGWCFGDQVKNSCHVLDLVIYSHSKRLIVWGLTF
jgi:hypothetical protein